MILGGDPFRAPKRATAIAPLGRLVTGQDQRVLLSLPSREATGSAQFPQPPAGACHDAFTHAAWLDDAARE
jgi:hypothetical protein